jgi:hypothetical protein
VNLALPRESGIVINGRIVGPIERGRFTVADLNALVEFELTKRTGRFSGLSRIRALGLLSLAGNGALESEDIFTI